MCKTKDKHILQNTTLRQTLSQLQVYCTQKSEGCQWIGELRLLDKHLNLNPTRSKWLQGCKFVSLQCLYCSTMFLRSEIGAHESCLCSKRPYSCEYCANYSSSHDDVTKNHWPECPYYPMQCPNGCIEITIPRHLLESHVSKICPLTVIDCAFKAVGCNIRAPRKEMEAHLDNAVTTHQCLTMIAKVQEKIDVTSKQITDVEQSIARIEETSVKQAAELSKTIDKMSKQIAKVEQLAATVGGNSKRLTTELGRSLTTGLSKHEENMTKLTAMVERTVQRFNDHIAKHVPKTEQKENMTKLVSKLEGAVQRVGDNTTKRTSELQNSITRNIAQMEEKMTKCVSECERTVANYMENIIVNTAKRDIEVTVREVAESRRSFVEENKTMIVVVIVFCVILNLFIVLWVSQMAEKIVNTTTDAYELLVSMMNN